jgi:hypothetical protein
VIGKTRGDGLVGPDRYRPLPPANNPRQENSMATKNRDDDIVRLASAPNPAQAHIWQQALAGEGIRAHVVGDYLDAGFGDIPGLKAEVWVHRDDLARAEEILRRSQDVSGESTATESES